MKPRYVVKVIDWTQQEVYVGTFHRHERAQALADRVNAGIAAGNERITAGHASVETLEPFGFRLADDLIEWALGYPDDETDEEQAEWERRANAEISG